MINKVCMNETKARAEIILALSVLLLFFFIVLNNYSFKCRYALVHCSKIACRFKLKVPVAVVRLHDGDMHAVGWGEGP